jgi:hypothetical protein
MNPWKQAGSHFFPPVKIGWDSEDHVITIGGHGNDVHHFW